MWNNIKNHPNFDEFWKERDARTSCYNLKPAILVVGGLYDSEDCYGAWNLYKAIKEQSPETDLYLTFGPWGMALGHATASKVSEMFILAKVLRLIIWMRFSIPSFAIFWKEKEKSPKIG